MQRWLFSLSLAGCTASQPPAQGPMHEHHDHHHGHGHFSDAHESAKHLDDPSRDEWQHPDEVVRALQLSPAMTVADVGAGTGYFAVRLARAVPQGQVIATDIEPDMVKYLNERAQREHLSNLRATSDKLAPRSVDAILVVHVWHHVDDRTAFAKELVAALKPGGRIIVVEFADGAHHGPPPEMRLAPPKVIADLAAAGLTATVSPIAVPEQYIVEAHAP